MKHHNVFFGVIIFGFCVTVARADIVEIRGEGYVNGEIQSDDGKLMKFKDNHGKVRSIPRGNVLYAEKEQKKVLKMNGGKYWENLKKSSEAVKQKTNEWTGKFIGTAGAPLDRSAADQKSRQLENALAEADKASAAAASKSSTAKREFHRQQNAAKADAHGSSSDESKGHFTSLSN